VTVLHLIVKVMFYLYASVNLKMALTNFCFLLFQLFMALLWIVGQLLTSFLYTPITKSVSISQLNNSVQTSAQSSGSIQNAGQSNGAINNASQSNGALKGGSIQDGSESMKRSDGECMNYYMSAEHRHYTWGQIIKGNSLCFLAIFSA